MEDQVTFPKVHMAEWRNECIPGETNALNNGMYFSACVQLFDVNAPFSFPSDLLRCLSWADIQAE